MKNSSSRSGVSSTWMLGFRKNRLGGPTYSTPNPLTSAPLRIQAFVRARSPAMAARQSSTSGVVEAWAVDAANQRGTRVGHIRTSNRVTRRSLDNRIRPFADEGGQATWHSTPRRSTRRLVIANR